MIIGRVDVFFQDRCPLVSAKGLRCDRLAAERHYLHRDPETGHYWIRIGRTP